MRGVTKPRSRLGDHQFEKMEEACSQRSIQPDFDSIRFEI